MWNDKTGFKYYNLFSLKDTYWLVLMKWRLSEIHLVSCLRKISFRKPGLCRKNPVNVFSAKVLLFLTFCLEEDTLPPTPSPPKKKKKVGLLKVSLTKNQWICSKYLLAILNQNLWANKLWKTCQVKYLNSLQEQFLHIVKKLQKETNFLKIMDMYSHRICTLSFHWFS